MKNKEMELKPEFKNYRELVEFSTKEYKDNIAYKYKRSLEEKPVKYIEKTYGEVGKDIKALATALLNQKNKLDRIAIIGGNRYEWVLSYFSVGCAGKVVAPMDKLLPEKEIQSLVKRSDVDGVISEGSISQSIMEFKNVDLPLENPPPSATTFFPISLS